MALSSFGRWPLILGSILALSACVEGSARRDGPEPLPQSGNARMTDRDFEAPEAFQAAEKGLWDGRPSLGGVWVAHPDVREPRRVLVRNTENGEEVIGALFRRERENPGPRIQISSDAAERLGILAGQPTDLRVVALEREEEEEEPAAEAVAAEAVAGETGAAPAEGEEAAAAPAGDVAATAAAAIDAAEDADGATVATPPVAEPQPVPEDRPPTSFGRRNRQPPPAPVPLAAPEGEAAEAAAAPDATAVLPADAAPADGAAPELQPELVPLAEPQPVPEDRPPTSFGRRNRQPAAEAPAVAAPGGAGEVTVAPLDPNAAPEAAPDAAAAAPAPASGGLGEPFLQAVVLSSEDAAQQAAAEIGGAGLAATVGEVAGNGGPLWRVLVGPAASRAERNAMLETLRSLGYADAYPVGF